MVGLTAQRKACAMRQAQSWLHWVQKQACLARSAVEVGVAVTEMVWVSRVCCHLCFVSSLTGWSDGTAAGEVNRSATHPNRFGSLNPDSGKRSPSSSCRGLQVIDRLQANGLSPWVEIRGHPFPLQGDRNGRLTCPAGAMTHPSRTRLEPQNHDPDRKGSRLDSDRHTFCLGRETRKPPFPPSTAFNHSFYLFGNSSF